ncbi:beta strand repeat-containing protein [Chloroflexota bacterium]
MKRKTLSVVFALVLALSYLLVLIPVPVQAAAITSTGAGGNWSATTTWAGGVVPGAADTVTITTGSPVTVDVANSACLTLLIGTGNGDVTLTFNSGSVLTVSSTLTIGSNSNKKGTIIMASGGTMQLGAGITIDGAGTWIPGTGTVDYNAAGGQTIDTTFFTAYNNLTLSGGDVKTTTGVTVNGILSMEGTATASAAPIYGAAATLQYNTATARTAGVEWITPFAATGGVIIANTGAITANAAKVFNANVPLTINSGATLAMSTYLLTLNGNLVNNGGTTSGSGGVTIAGTATQSIGAFTNTGTISMTKTAGTATFTGNVNGGALTINGSGGTLNLGTGLTHTFTGTWTRTNGTLNGGSSTLKIGGVVSGSGSTFTAGTGTVEWNGSAQAIAAVTYNNLTINQASGDATLGANIAVNGILTLTAGNLAVTDPYVLTMGASATTVGANDVTGIVKRTTLVADTAYTFGSQYTTLYFQDVGTLPDDVSIKITIGSAPAWKTDAITRTHDIIRTGGSGSFATLNLHYRDAELNGNTENKLVLWYCVSPFTPGTGIEFGRSNYNETNNWIGAANIEITLLATSFGELPGTLGDSDLSNCTWNGSVSTNWSNVENWTPNGVPSDLVDVVIPDASGTTYDPILNQTLAVGRLTLNSGAILNSAAGSVVAISGASGAWSNNGGTFNPNTGTVVFTNAEATISGETSFYNVTIDTGAGLTLGSDVIMQIGGTMTNNGIWSVGGLHNTVEYSGAGQTVLNPNGLTSGYHTLVLSGSGAKTMPGTELYLHDNFSMSGTAYATAGAAINTDGNFTVGSDNAFTMGAFTHTIGGDFSNSGTLTATGGTITIGGDFSNSGTLTATGGTITIGGDFSNSDTLTATGSTITLNGTTAQAISGTTETAFNNLNISNTNAAASANTNFSVGGTLTVNASAVLNPAAAVVVSGAGTLTGNGTVNVTRTAATADFSSQYTISTKTLTNLTAAYVGSAAQTVSALTYGGLKIDNASGVTLGGNATVNGTLTLISGKITTDASTVIIGSSGSVSGGSSSNYVYGNLQKNVATGSDVSRTFEVGTASNYNPVTVLFASVSVAENLTAKVTTGEHPEIASSRIDSSKDVNAYWTFTNAGITFDSYGATFTFVSGDVDGGAHTSLFIVGRYSGGWTYPTLGTRTSTSTQATGLVSLSDFAIGEYPWQSYKEETYTTVWGTVADPYDDAYDMAYMYGEGFLASQLYHVGFYCPSVAPNKVASTDPTSTAGGALSTQYLLSTDPSAESGTWHAVVYKDPDSPPTNYDPNDPDAVIDDDFQVAASAIPEFPTVIAGIAMAGLCFDIYYWMRKKKARVCQN